MSSQTSSTIRLGPSCSCLSESPRTWLCLPRGLYLCHSCSTSLAVLFLRPKDLLCISIGLQPVPIRKRMPGLHCYQGLPSVLVEQRSLPKLLHLTPTSLLRPSVADSWAKRSASQVRYSSDQESSLDLWALFSSVHTSAPRALSRCWHVPLRLEHHRKSPSEYSLQA